MLYQFGKRCNFNKNNLYYLNSCHILLKCSLKTTEICFQCHRSKRLHFQSKFQFYYTFQMDSHTECNSHVKRRQTCVLADNPFITLETIPLNCIRLRYDLKSINIVAWLIDTGIQMKKIRSKPPILSIINKEFVYFEFYWFETES